jgi:drug/metabolite transporter (DMT)-like permease
VNRTSAANTSLLLATTPIFVVLLGSILGIERVPKAAWWGIFISFAGIYVIVAARPGGFTLSSVGVGGDLLILAGTVLWAFYTVLSKPFLKTISPLQFSAVTMIFGAAFYLPFTVRDMLALRPADISVKAWLSLGFSAVFGLVLGYLIWYYSVQRVGNARTAAYNNVTPIATALFAAWLLKDPLRPVQAVGAAVILFGVWMTRSGHRHLRRSPSD